MDSTLNKEREFHDRVASLEDGSPVDIRKFFGSSTTPEVNYIVEQLGSLKGKRLLDIGCGFGESSVNFALLGAHCTALDLSPGMLERCKENARAYGVAVKTLESSAERIGLPDAHFDIVYAANILHHADPVAVIKEAYRLLKDGGRFCFWDPLAHNPIINLYRRMATEVRTDDEHPLTIDILDDVGGYFSNVEHDTFWISALWIFLRFYIIEHVDPNKERYWRKIIMEEERLRPTARRLHAFDNLLKKIPFMSRFAWNIAVVATK